MWKCMAALFHLLLHPFTCILLIVSFFSTASYKYVCLELYNERLLSTCYFLNLCYSNTRLLFSLHTIYIHGACTCYTFNLHVYWHSVGELLFTTSYNIMATRRCMIKVVAFFSMYSFVKLFIHLCSAGKFLLAISYILQDVSRLLFSPLVNFEIWILFFICQCANLCIPLSSEGKPLSVIRSVVQSTELNISLFSICYLCIHQFSCIW